MILITCILQFIEPRLFHTRHGSEKLGDDNILILIMAIQHLLETTPENESTHLLTALKEYGVSTKYCRLVRATYEVATVKAKIQEVGGTRN